MSEATHPTGGLTRRGFLKTTGAAAAGLACAGAVGVAIGGGAPPSAASGGAVEAFLRLGGISEKTANYGALAVWLCNAYCMNA